MASALEPQCCTNLARKSHALGANQLVEFILNVNGMKHMQMM